MDDGASEEAESLPCADTLDYCPICTDIAIGLGARGISDSVAWSVSKPGMIDAC